ncbi:MAG: TGS domain-containing protein, partial [Candidatus Poribacteria bacterium]|nr:TGS domain-containing protein [Candidatus Poribacteria bacterium]
MDSINVTLPDGSVKEVPKGITAIQFAEHIGERLAKAVVTVEINGALKDLTTTLTQDATVTFHTFDSDKGKEVYRHTTAHVLAQAVQRLRPEAKVTIGPPIEDGFYYDFDTEPFRPEDLEAIQKEMEKIVKEDHSTHRSEVSRDEAYELFKEMGEPYKLELLDAIPAGEVVSLYKQGEFTDLCRGPHLPTTSRIKAIKLLSTGGAYWRGDERNKQLQRIYGTSFEKPAQLEAHLKNLEEAERRDHRRVGKQLDLYSTHQDLGGGLVLWHPKGALV